MAQLSFDVDVSWLPGGHPSSSRKHGKLNEIESCGPFLMHTGCSQVAIAVPKISCFVSSPRFGYRVFMGFPIGFPLNCSRFSASPATPAAQVVIVGGGQCGLALAARLQRMSLPYVVLDQHPRPGDSWRNRGWTVKSLRAIG